jgi:hypothetical protein
MDSLVVLESIDREKDVGISLDRGTVWTNLGYRRSLASLHFDFNISSALNS